MQKTFMMRALAWLLLLCLSIGALPPVYATELPSTEPETIQDIPTVEAAEPAGAAVPADPITVPESEQTETPAEQPDDPLPEIPPVHTQTTTNPAPDDPPAEPITGIEAFLLPEDAISCSFSDVALSDWYYNAVAYGYSLGLVNGRSSDRFDPQSTITAAEAIALSVRVHQKYHALTEELTAADGEPWYTPYIAYAKDHGLIPAGIDELTAPITRQQAAAVFCRTLPEAELAAINTITEIPDVGQNNPYLPQILTLYNAGILTGTDAVYGTFRPTQQLARSEFVQLLYKLILPTARTQQSFSRYTGMDALDADRYELRCTFRDVAKDSWYHTSVAVQQALGLLQGKSAERFAPDDSVTLAEATAISVRIYRRYHGIADPITTTDGEDWYAPYITLAREYGILPADWTDYTAPITRIRAASLMYNTLPTQELGAINQVAAIPDVAASVSGYQQVLALYNAGVLTGNDKYGNFTPAAYLTRAQFAAMTTRLIDPDYRQKFTLVTDVVGEKIVYGTSGAGRELVAYRYGSGKNVMVVGFAIHGFEDNYARDGYELVYTAEALMKKLESSMSTVKNGDWSVYVLPCMNPDGLYDGYTNSGPGRCTTTYLTGGKLSTGHGIDMNRCFPRNFRVHTNSRNYTGSTPLACREAQALAAFIQQVKGSGTNVCIDTHGWTQQIMTTTGTGGLLYRTFKQQFGGNTYANCTYSGGYFTAYAASLGYHACLFEFPGGIYSHNAFLSSGYSAKYIACIMTLLNKY